MAKGKPFVVKSGSQAPDKKVGFGKFKEKDLIWVAKNEFEFFKQIEALYYPKYNEEKKVYYNSLKKKFSKIEDLSINKFEKEIIEVVDLLKLKWTSFQIQDYLQGKYDLSESNRGLIISDAIALIRQSFELEKTFLIDIHLLRYEEIFLENLNANLDEVPVGYKKAMKCEHLITAMDTLFQKEKLLGIHTKAFKLKATESMLQRPDTEFDMTILTANERLELFSLLKKAKNVEKLNKPFLENNNPLNIDLKVQTDHDDDIKASPIKKAKQTDIKAENEALSVKEGGKSLFEVQTNIQSTLKDKVKELFEKKKKENLS